MERYKYAITSTHASSDKYGACEVCKKRASEVFSQSEQREYFSPLKNRESKTFAGCRPHIFGHKKCLISVRR